MFENNRAVLPPVLETKLERFLTTTKKAQTFILTFAVEVPRYVASPSPRSPSKRPAAPPKAGPRRTAEDTAPRRMDTAAVQRDRKRTPTRGSTVRGVPE